MPIFIGTMEECLEAHESLETLASCPAAIYPFKTGIQFEASGDNAVWKNFDDEDIVANFFTKTQLN